MMAGPRAPAAEPDDRRLLKLARISFNSCDWRRPTGEAKKLEAKDTYNARVGFGQEDWLFRDEWQIGLWRYAFLQGVNKSRAKLLRDGRAFDVTLFTIKEDKSRAYVAFIRGVECLSDRQADDALQAFRDNGWFDAMEREIASVGGDTNALLNARWSRDIVNVRFRLDNVLRLNRLVAPGDAAAVLHRYMLYDAERVGGAEQPAIRRRRAGQAEPPQQPTYVRPAVGPVSVSPEHARMQAALKTELAAEFPSAEILFESDYVDVVVRTSDLEMLFEIKTDLEPRMVLRHAIGQLLEYAHRESPRRLGSLKLVAVGRRALSLADHAYLHTLRQQYNLPIEYRVVTV